MNTQARTSEQYGTWTDNGAFWLTGHTVACTAVVIDAITENAQDDGQIGRDEWLDADSTVWGTNVAALAALYLSDGSATCYCH